MYVILSEHYIFKKDFKTVSSTVLKVGDETLLRLLKSSKESQATQRRKLLCARESGQPGSALRRGSYTHADPPVFSHLEGGRIFSHDLYSASFYFSVLSKHMEEATEM